MEVGVTKSRVSFNLYFVAAASAQSWLPAKDDNCCSSVPTKAIKKKSKQKFWTRGAPLNDI